MSERITVRQKNIDLEKIDKIEKEKLQKPRDQDRIDQVEREKEDIPQPTQSDEK